MVDFRKDLADPPASGNTGKAVIFVVKPTQSADKAFDFFITGSDGFAYRLDRPGAKLSSGASPHANPRNGDQWLDTDTDHMFVWGSDGNQQCWMDLT